jgi:hypothetical protein
MEHRKHETTLKTTLEPNATLVETPFGARIIDRKK